MFYICIIKKNIRNMLQFKIKEILQASGIKNPYKWLVKSGFGHLKAINLLKNEQKTITQKDMSKLCYLLYCTPNDLFYWSQTTIYELPNDHPIRTQLKDAPLHANWLDLVRQVNNKGQAIQLQEQVAKMIEEMKAKKPE
jgi:hypothetical protein